MREIKFRAWYREFIRNPRPFKVTIKEEKAMKYGLYIERGAMYLWSFPYMLTETKPVWEKTIRGLTFSIRRKKKLS